MRCYRYMDFEHGLRAFETGFFKVAKPSEFNDPYECYGLVTGDLRDEVLENFVRADFKRLCGDREKTVGIIPREVFCSPEKMIEWYRPRLSRSIRQQILNKQISDQHLRVLCFVAKDGLSPESDALMWSHYATGGLGVRIEFEISEEKMAAPCALRHVKYSPVAPTIDLGVCRKWPNSKPFYDFLEQCLWAKGEAWRYENEVRLIFSSRLSARVLTPLKCDDGVVRDFVRFHMNDIKGLTFGPKVKPDVWVGCYTQYCKEHPNGSVVFERAVVGSDRYHYGYENLEQSMEQVVKGIIEDKMARRCSLESVESTWKER